MAAPTPPDRRTPGPEKQFLGRSNKFAMIVAAVAMLAIGGRAQAQNLVVNGGFQMYKPGEPTVTAVFSNANSYTGGFEGTVTLQGGTVNYSDATTGTTIVMPGWVNVLTPGAGLFGLGVGGSTSMETFGSWGGSNGDIIGSATSLGTISGDGYTLSALVKGGDATPSPILGGLTLALMANGVVIAPTSEVNPTTDIPGTFQVISRTYDAAALTPYIGQAITVKFGTNPGNSNGGRASWDDVQLTARGASNVNLTRLVPIPGVTFTPTFDSATTTYTASVPYATSTMTVTPTAENPGAAVTVAGLPVTYGSPSSTIDLGVGDTVINTVVAAEDNPLTFKTYTLTVTRAAPSTNADLSNLVSSVGLAPTFETGITSYTASVPYATSTMTVTPTVADPLSMIKVNDSPVASGSRSGTIDLDVGATVITTVVTPQDPMTLPRTYTLTVTRAAASTNADLSNLESSVGLSPTFNSGTISYTASVVYPAPSMTVTPTVADPLSTIKVNGTTVTSGDASAPISLNPGANVIDTVVTAEDASTKTYTLTVTFTVADPVAIPGGPYSVSMLGSLALNGSASLPPNGQSITTYEWDLNLNDNGGEFNANVTGVTPASITYANLKTIHGMAVGANTIKLRVTDDSPTPKTATATATVTLGPPLGCQLGVLNLTANGGINPNTGALWKVGDKYRIAFHTLGTTTTTSNNPEFYNDFATTQAWTVTALQGTYWRAMVTVNLDSTTTEALSPKRHVKDNTGTGVLTGGSNQGGAGEPVYVVNGTTCIARNNADIWNTWSNPFENSLGVANALGTGNNTTRVAGVFYSPYLNQNGAQTVTPNAVHGKDIATGCNTDGSHVNALGNTADNTTISRGNTNANNTGRVWNRFTNNTTDSLSLYAISVPLTVVDTSEAVKPTLISFVDDRSGADLALGTGSIAYTVTFSETIDAATLTIDDFENAGSAAVTIDRIRGTVDPSAFNVTVTPTTTGTVQLQTKVGAVIEDPVGNAMDTTSPIADETIINVVSDTTAPMLVSIADNVSGGPIVAFNGVTYTVTFDEPINASTLDIADFANGGTAPITVNSVKPTGNPAVYIVSVTPTGAGSLTLEIVAGATISDLTGNPLVTTEAVPDDTTITVTPDPLPTLVSIVDNQAGGPVFATQSFMYLVTFSLVVNPSTVEVTDFENGTTPALTVNAVARTSDPKVFAVHVTPGGAGTITLQIKAGAVITNVNGTALDTTSALADDTPITVNAGSGPARGTITVDGTVAFFANSATISGTLNASGSDKLVVIVTGEHGNPGDLNGNSTAVTYDGVALTKVVDRNPIGGTPFDQTFNDIWYLDNPSTSTGAIVASVNTRGNVTAFALSGTAPGVGQTAISPQASKSVVLSTGFANSIVIASHGMGGDGNTANVTAVNALLPLIEKSAQNNGAGSLWDGHVTASALVPAAGTATYAFTGGNLVGSHTIAAEFLAAELLGFDLWKATNGATGQALGQDHDSDGVPNGIEYFIGGPAGTTTGFTALPGVDNAAGALSVTWTKAAGYTGVYPTDFVVETSDTLTGTWTPQTLGGTVIITGNNVKFTFPAGVRNFARLKVTGP